MAAPSAPAPSTATLGSFMIRSSDRLVGRVQRTRGASALRPPVAPRCWNPPSCSQGPPVSEREGIACESFASLTPGRYPHVPAGDPVNRRRTVAPESPTFANFEAASSFLDREDIRAAVGCGPDAKRHLEVAQRFVDADLDRHALMNSVLDVEDFFRACRRRAIRRRSRAATVVARPSGALVMRTNCGPSDMGVALGWTLDDSRRRRPTRREPRHLDDLTSPAVPSRSAARRLAT